MENLKASLFANLSSVCLFAPIDLLKTNLAINPKLNKNIKGFALTLYKQEGIKGFYKGLGVNLATTPLSNSIYMTIYEKLKYIDVDCSQNQKQLFASIASGIISNLITNPLWILKTRIQTGSNKKLLSNITSIYQKEGIKGFYKGLGSSFLGLSHLAIYYPLYEFSKKHLQNNNNNSLKSQDIIMASTFAKFIAMMTTYPSNIITTKQQYSTQSQSLINVIQTTFQENGIKGFFSGIKVDLARTIPSTALTFLMYESIRQSAATSAD